MTISRSDALDQVLELNAAYRAGVPINALAVQLQIHRSTVLDHVTRTGTRRRYPALVPVEIRRLLSSTKMADRCERLLSSLGCTPAPSGVLS
jgi:hypothetical protein